jgi:hypothetical protein
VSLQVHIIQRQDFDGGYSVHRESVTVCCFTVGPTWVGALVAVCDNHPGHADCMFLLS